MGRGPCFGGRRRTDKKIIDAGVDLSFHGQSGVENAGQKERSVLCEKVNHLAFGLTVGGCNLCPECPPAGEPCRRPLEARPGADGFGVETELNFLGMIFV